MGELINFSDWYKKSGEVLDENDEAMAQVYAISGIKRVIQPSGEPAEEVPPEPPDIVA